MLRDLLFFWPFPTETFILEQIASKNGLDFIVGFHPGPIHLPIRKRRRQFLFAFRCSSRRYLVWVMMPSWRNWPRFERPLEIE